VPQPDRPLFHSRFAVPSGQRAVANRMGPSLTSNKPCSANLFLKMNTTDRVSASPFRLWCAFF
jgi:hypothetical protein